MEASLLAVNNSFSFFASLNNLSTDFGLFIISSYCWSVKERRNIFGLTAHDHVSLLAVHKIGHILRPLCRGVSQVVYRIVQSPQFCGSLSDLLLHVFPVALLLLSASYSAASTCSFARPFIGQGLRHHSLGGRSVECQRSVTQNSGVKSNIKPPPPPAYKALDVHTFDEVALVRGNALYS